MNSEMFQEMYFFAHFSRKHFSPSDVQSLGNSFCHVVVLLSLYYAPQIVFISYFLWLEIIVTRCVCVCLKYVCSLEFLLWRVLRDRARILYIILYPLKVGFSYSLVELENYNQQLFNISNTSYQLIWFQSICRYDIYKVEKWHTLWIKMYPIVINSSYWAFSLLTKYWHIILTIS